MVDSRIDSFHVPGVFASHHRQRPSRMKPARRSGNATTIPAFYVNSFHGEEKESLTCNASARELDWNSDQDQCSWQLIYMSLPAAYYTGWVSFLSGAASAPSCHFVGYGVFVIPRLRLCVFRRCRFSAPPRYAPPHIHNAPSLLVTLTLPRPAPAFGLSYENGYSYIPRCGLNRVDPSPSARLRYDIGRPAGASMVGARAPRTRYVATMPLFPLLALRKSPDAPADSARRPPSVDLPRAPVFVRLPTDVRAKHDVLARDPLSSSFLAPGGSMIMMHRMRGPAARVLVRPGTVPSSSVVAGEEAISTTTAPISSSCPLPVLPPDPHRPARSLDGAEEHVLIHPHSMNNGVSPLR
ncbi:hypothetical protein B0H14DRAFT_3877330 [Mycena olivaceomarginata]|nr:hypothetical protein B0H14DRAFT_3877330 [Mycena olivaceomarginata]